MSVFGEFQIEIANRIARGRAVGTDYVVTRRPAGHTGIIATFTTRDDAVAWARRQAALAAIEREFPIPESGHFTDSIE